jgi:hypothetical protein
MKIQMDLRGEYLLMDKKKKLYDEAYASYALIRKIKDEKNANWKTFFGSKESHLEKVRKKFAQARINLNRARTEYILQVEAVNAVHKHYYNSVLHNLMEYNDDHYYVFFNNVLSEFLNIEIESSKKQIKCCDNVKLSVDGIDRNKDNFTFLTENEALFTASPSSFKFVPASNIDDEERCIIFPDQITQDRANYLKQSQVSLEVLIEKKVKEFRAAHNLKNTYLKNPTVGEGDKIHETRLNITNELEALLCAKCKVDSQINTLIHSGVKITIVPEKKEYAVSETLSFARRATMSPMPEKIIIQDNEVLIKQKATALYDYVSNTGSELNLKVNDVVYVLEDPKANQNGWLRCEKEGKLGLAPATYLKVLKTPSMPPPPIPPPRQKVEFYRVNEEYNSEDPTIILSIKPGDIIRLVNKNTSSEEWWEGILNGTRGHFPHAFVTQIYKVTAIYDFEPDEPGEMKLTKGDVIDIVDEGTTDEWWFGKNKETGQEGEFPKTYVSA